MLADCYNESELEDLLLDSEEFNPFPRERDRKQWENIPEHLKKRAVELGEASLNFKWPSLLASHYMDFYNSRKERRYNTTPRRKALSHLALAECVEGKRRFLEQILNGIWATCEESSWCGSFENETPTSGLKPLPDIEEPIIDRNAPKIAARLAWIYYLLYDELSNISDLITRRIEIELDKRIITPFLNRDDFYWMGFRPRDYINNWTPDVVANCLTVFLLVEKDPERRIRAIYKALRSLDVFLDYYGEEGGCDEGPTYWNIAGGTLFESLELLYLASRGKIDFYDNLKVQNIGKYIYRVHIAGDYFVNFADAKGRIDVDSFLIYRYGKRINDENLCRLGLYAFQQRDDMDWIFSNKPNRFLPAIFNYEEMEEQEKVTPAYLQDTWIGDIEVMCAREKEGSKDGLYLACKAGHNLESHNHNDVGNFIVYLNGSPVIIDTGTGYYTRKTFSPERYDIWTMQSAYHNLPVINGGQQRTGRRWKVDSAEESNNYDVDPRGNKNYKPGKVTYNCDKNKSELEVDIGPLYPEESGVLSWVRSCRMIRMEKTLIEITDAFKLTDPTSDIILPIMTVCKPDTGKGKVWLENMEDDKILVRYNPALLEVDYKKIKLEEKKLTNVWGDSIYRLQFKLQSCLKTGEISLVIEQE